MVFTYKNEFQNRREKKARIKFVNCTSVCTAYGGRNIETANVRNGNTKAPSSKYCCSGKAASVTYSVCVCVALGMQHCNAHALCCRR